MDSRKRQKIEDMLVLLRQSFELAKGDSAKRTYIAGKWAGLRIALEVEDNIQ